MVLIISMANTVDQHAVIGAFPSLELCEAAAKNRPSSMKCYSAEAFSSLTHKK
jgi:hypothetical protein